MRTSLKKYKVREIVDRFVYNEFEGKGIFGLSGKLTIQPEYQRNYIYADGKRDVAVIDSLLKCSVASYAQPSVVVCDMADDGWSSSSNQSLIRVMYSCASAEVWQDE